MNQIYVYIPSKQLLIAADTNESVKDWVKLNIYDVFQITKDDIQMLTKAEYAVKNKELIDQKLSKEQIKIKEWELKHSIKKEKEKMEYIKEVLAELVDLNVISKKNMDDKIAKMQTKIDNMKKDIK